MGFSGIPVVPGLFASLGWVAPQVVDVDLSDNLKLTLGLLYNLGLTTAFEDRMAKNRTLSIVAGVGFPIG